MEQQSRRINEAVSNRLWGRAAGRCQFDGCNRPLFRSPITQEDVNISERAHVYPFSPGGPRRSEDTGPDDLNEIDNLMLLCHDCHRKIDKAKDGGRYPVELLRAWKQAHERRIELVTGIHPSKRTHVILYGANIGQASAPLSAASTTPALFPDRYPASEHPIELGMVNSAWNDRNDAFWRIEEGNLVEQFRQKVKPGLAKGEIEHLSVFGLAPQPLLIRLGAELTDIPPVDVYPLLREPKGWGWGEGPDLEFAAVAPSTKCKTPALVFSLSATVAHERIRGVLGSDVSVWELKVLRPSNDAIRTRAHLRAFRCALRSLLNEIKFVHGQTQMLHVFPAISVAAAVELGRVRMPKADSPWLIYDQINDRGGFVPALRIPGEDE